MTVSLSSSNVNSSPNFKGSVKRTEQGNPYYSTNSGTKIGAGLAAFEVLGGAGMIAAGDFFKKMPDSMVKDISLSAADKELVKMSSEFYKKMGKMALCFAPVYLGCGMIVDYLRNQKAKKAADLVGQVGVKNAMAQNSDIDISHRNKPYLNTNSGGKNGALGGWLLGMWADHNSNKAAEKYS